MKISSLKSESAIDMSFLISEINSSINNTVKVSQLSYMINSGYMYKHGKWIFVKHVLYIKHTYSVGQDSWWH